MKKMIFTLSMLIALVLGAQAQVQFDVTYDQETERYTVHFVSQSTWSFPNNITGGAQVTIKTPASQFEVTDLQSLIPNVEWEDNAKVYAPEEAPQFDYISFGLATGGTDLIPYNEGEATAIFSFRNNLGCTGEIFLLSNDDPFYPPNSMSANVGNSLSTLGGGESYAGNLSGEGISCAAVTTDVDVAELPELGAFSAYPNPATDFVQVEFDWQETAGEATIKVWDLQGKDIQQSETVLVQGENRVRINVSNLSGGTYLVGVSANGQLYRAGKIVRK